MQHKAVVDTRILFIDMMCLSQRCDKDTKFFIQSFIYSANLYGRPFLCKQVNRKKNPTPSKSARVWEIVSASWLPMLCM